MRKKQKRRLSSYAENYPVSSTTTHNDEQRNEKSKEGGTVAQTPDHPGYVSSKFRKKLQNSVKGFHYQTIAIVV